MVFRRRNMALRPVHRLKHVVDAQFAISAGTAVNTIIINSIDAPVIGNTSEVETGSTINGIYLNVEGYQTSATGGALSNFYMIVFKNPGGNLTVPTPNVVGADDNKKYVIHQEMRMRQNLDNGNPRTLFNGVIAIPKGYRRFGIRDLLQVSVFTPAGTMDICIQAIYKEFR